MDGASDSVIRERRAVQRFEQVCRTGDAGAPEAQQSSQVSCSTASHAVEESQLETNDHPMVPHLDRAGDL